jgi:hypothetical protein
MKTIVLAAAVAAVIASPALAASSHTGRHLHHDRQTSDPVLSMQRIDPIGVYVDGREIGRDPDPAIRAELLSEYYQEQSE